MGSSRGNGHIARSYVLLITVRACDYIMFGDVPGRSRPFLGIARKLHKRGEQGVFPGIIVP